MSHFLAVRNWAECPEKTVNKGFFGVHCQSSIGVFASGREMRRISRARLPYSFPRALRSKLHNFDVNERE